MHKVISIYFNGTKDRNFIPQDQPGLITLAALLNQLTVNDLNSISMCINGCAVNNADFRDFNYIFSFHLTKQVSDIAEKVKNEIKSGYHIVLNLYGHSRGGVAAFLLAQKLKHIPVDRLTINIVSFEPVPCNFIGSAHADIWLGTNSTLTATVADLRKCKNIKNILVLFTNQPYPFIRCYAPVLPVLPESSDSEVDVTPGRHNSAVVFYKIGNKITAGNDESIIVFHRIIEFLKKCGTVFNFSVYQLDPALICKKQKLLELYDDLAKKILGNKNRSMHLGNSIFTKDGQRYLNLYHQRLSGENINNTECVLSLKDSYSHTRSRL